MQLVNDFAVGRPVDEAWPVLSDVESLVTCIPGATLVSREEDRYHGQVAIRVGPIALKFEGDAEVLALDEASRTLSIRGVGRDRGGQGSVTALITMRAESGPGEDGTAVTVTTDLDLGGKVAQFGSGMIEKVAGRLIKQFVTRLEDQFSTETTATGTSPAVRPARPAARGSVVGEASRTEVVESSIELLVVAVGAFLAGFSLRRAFTR